MYLKRVAKIFQYFVLSLVIFFALMLAVVNLPFSQRKITGKANVFFQKKEIPLKVEKITILVNGKIGLIRPQLIKDAGDTILYAEQISGSVRVIPILFRNVKVKALSVINATVYITTDTITGRPDLIELFSGRGKTPKTKEKSAKKWDIKAESLTLENIRFAWNDSYHGIQINQTVGKLSVRLDDFSLTGRHVYAALADLEDVHGGVTLKKRMVEKEIVAGKSPAAWKFRLSNSDLKNVSFTLHQSEKNQMMKFSVGKSDISDAFVSLADHRISVAELSLEDPEAQIFSEPSGKKPEAGSEDVASNSFPGPWNISGGDLKITGGSFTADASIQVTAMNTMINDLLLTSEGSGLTMSRLSFRLGNGFQLERGELAFVSDSTGRSQLDTKLMTPSSRINLRIQAGKKLADLFRSFRSVYFNLNTNGTEISSQDILCFLPDHKEHYSELGNGNFSVKIDFEASGTADSLSINNLSLRTTTGIACAIAGQLKGITEPSSAAFSIDFRAENISSSRLMELIQLTGSSIKLPDFDTLTLSGNISDTFNSPIFSVALNTRSDSIKLNGSVNVTERKYWLEAASYGVHLGELSGIKGLGRFTGFIDLSGHGYRPESMNVKATLSVDSITYREYVYKDIGVEIAGDKGQHVFTVNAGDPAFTCDLEGTLSLGERLTGAGISGSFAFDAGKLNLYKGIYANGLLDAGMNKSQDGITAFLSLGDLAISTADRAEELKSLSLSLQTSDTLLSAKVQSDFVDAEASIAGSVDDIKKAFAEGRIRLISLLDSTAGNRIPVISALPEAFVSVEATYDPFIGILLNDSLFSYNNVSLSLIKEKTGTAKADVSVNRFTLGSGSGFGASLHFESLPDTTILRVLADSVRLGGIALFALAADIATTFDNTLYSLRASDMGKQLLYDIEGSVRRSKNKIMMQATQPEWIINGFRWTVAQGDFLVMEPQKGDFTADLHWKNDKSSIDIFGSKLEKIYIQCLDVWLNMLLVPGMNTYGYDGGISGKVEYTGGRVNDIGGRIEIRQMQMAERLIGDLFASGNFVYDTLGTADGDIKIVLNDTSALNLDIRYGADDNRNGIRTEFASMPLDIFESIVSKYISGLKGEVSGELELLSENNRPQMNGSVSFKNTSLKLVPVNALFYLQDGDIKLKDNKLYFNQFTILDSAQNRLNLNGNINLSDPDNILADLQVTSDKLQVMNTTEKDNPAFHGSVYVNSRLSIRGQLQSPSIEGSIVLADGTVINYRYMENLTVSETQKLITFASLDQDTVVTDSKARATNPLSKSPDIDATIEIDPRSLFSFEISRGFDIGVKITGGGFLTYSLMPNGVVDLSGTYSINKGDAVLKLPGWPRKDFIITPGSYLKWDGRIDDPELNFETTSKVRGSYYNPVDEQNREVNFLVNMKLTGRISQLEILFDVSSQDQYITTVFNSLSKDERMKQAINLLIFERIELPNVASSSDYVSQQINQFWESQINQITGAIFKKVDVSFGIDTFTGTTEGGAEDTYTSFTYEVKKTMFKDRGSVLVSGRMNDNSPASQQSNTVIENFIFEYALDTTHTKYVKVYRQQNYEDLLEGEVVKSGIGFIYRKNYDRLSDIWRRKRRNRQ